MNKKQTTLIYAYLALLIGYYLGSHIVLVKAQEPKAVEGIQEAIKSPVSVPISHDDQIYLLTEEIFGENAKVMFAILKAENRTLDCQIVSKQNRNGTRDYGLAQINSIHFDRIHPLDALDCRKSLEFSKKLYDERGNFTAWSTFNSGKYQKFLNN